MSKAKKQLAEKAVEQFAFGFGVDDSIALDSWLRMAVLHTAGQVVAEVVVLEQGGSEGKLNYEVAA